MNNTLKFLLCSVALIPTWSQAITISSLIEMSNDGKGEFLVTNPASKRQFMNVTISKMEIENGNLKEIPFTRENIKDWDLAVKPARTILEPKLQKSFKVKYLGNHKDLTRDQIYKLSYVPTPYFEEGKQPDNSVNIAMGFAPYFIVTANKDQPLKYNISRDSNGLNIENLGDTLINAEINACTEEVKKGCTMTLHLVSGRVLKSSLNDFMNQSKELTVTLKTNHRTYEKTLKIRQDQTLKG